MLVWRLLVVSTEGEGHYICHLSRYAISFAALVAATAAEAEYWGTPKDIQGGILFFLVPLFLLILNAFGIEVCSPLHSFAQAYTDQLSRCMASLRSSAAF